MEVSDNGQGVEEENFEGLSESHSQQLTKLYFSHFVVLIFLHLYPQLWSTIHRNWEISPTWFTSRRLASVVKPWAHCVPSGLFLYLRSVSHCKSNSAQCCYNRNRICHDALICYPIMIFVINMKRFVSNQYWMAITPISEIHIIVVDPAWMMAESLLMFLEVLLHIQHRGTIRITLIEVSVSEIRIVILMT